MQRYTPIISLYIYITMNIGSICACKNLTFHCHSYLAGFYFKILLEECACLISGATPVPVSDS